MSVDLYKVFKIENQDDMKKRLFLSFVNFAVLLEVSFFERHEKNFFILAVRPLFRFHSVNCRSIKLY